MVQTIGIMAWKWPLTVRARCDCIRIIGTETPLRGSVRDLEVVVVFVVKGTPYDVSDVRTFDTQSGTVRKVTFAVEHPEVPKPSGPDDRVWVDRFAAEQANVEVVQDAAKAGKPVEMLMRTFRRPGGKDGFWFETVLIRIVG